MTIMLIPANLLPPFTRAHAASEWTTLGNRAQPPIPKPRPRAIGRAPLRSAIDRGFLRRGHLCPRRDPAAVIRGQVRAETPSSKCGKPMTHSTFPFLRPALFSGLGPMTLHEDSFFVPLKSYITAEPSCRPIFIARDGKSLSAYRRPTGPSCRAAH